MPPSVFWSAARATTVITVMSVMSLMSVMSGCLPLVADGFSAQTKAGVLIAEDGTAYLTVTPCINKRVTSMELTLLPVADSRPAALRGARLAMRYEFDPPVDASRAFGPIDPSRPVKGATLTQFDQDVYDSILATRTGSLGDEPTVPVGQVSVEFVGADGQPRSAWGYWFADQTEPTVWYAPGHNKAGSTDFGCGDDPGWDLSVLGAE